VTERQEFPAKVRLAAFERAKKKCERCPAMLIPGKFRYNHRIPDALGGQPTLENCEVLCLACDSEQTYKTDIPAIAKSKRIRKREAGVRKPRTMTRWRKFDGTVVVADRER
jgi:5-methylcytosine-specific restriction protein A